MSLALIVAGSFASIVAAVGTLASVAGVIVALFRIHTVHVIVNSANTELRERVEQLAGALQDSGVQIPKTPREQAASPQPSAPIPRKP